MCADCDPEPGPDPLPAFEEIDVRAGQDFSAIARAALAPSPALVGWLDRQPPPAGDTALISRCRGRSAAGKGPVFPWVNLFRHPGRCGLVERGCMPMGVHVSHRRPPRSPQGGAVRAAPAGAAHRH